MIDLVAVGIGGFFGAVGRYLVCLFLGKICCGGFPAGTLTVNLVGSFALGVLVAQPHLGNELLGGSMRLALSLGFLGSFTTFSTFMFEILTLQRDNKIRVSLIYTFVSILGGLVLAWTAIIIS